jgi:hypothetical protein
MKKKMKLGNGINNYFLPNDKPVLVIAAKINPSYKANKIYD